MIQGIASIISFVLGAIAEMFVQNSIKSFWRVLTSKKNLTNQEINNPDDDVKISDEKSNPSQEGFNFRDFLLPP